LNNYFRLGCPTEVPPYDLHAMIAKLMPVVHCCLPDEFLSSNGNMEDNVIDFLKQYFNYIASNPISEQVVNYSMSSKEAVWIAAAALTYNEYLRTNSSEVNSYLFTQNNIAQLAFSFNPQTAMATYSQVTGQSVTQGKNAQHYAYLIPNNEKRRIAANSEDTRIRPDPLMSDFPVSTIDGIHTVHELANFISTVYTSFIETGVWSEFTTHQALSGSIDERNRSMSFQRDNFIAYLMKKGDRNANTYCSYLSRLERDFSVNIDEEYERDHFKRILDILKVKSDECRQDDKKTYDALKQMRQALRKYNEFRSGKINDNHKAITMDNTASTDVQLNTILYGPPGTGKTYHTVIYSVAIIEKKS